MKIRYKCMHDPSQQKVRENDIHIQTSQRYTYIKLHTKNTFK